MQGGGNDAPPCKCASRIMSNLQLVNIMEDYLIYVITAVIVLFVVFVLSHKPKETTVKGPDFLAEMRAKYPGAKEYFSASTQAYVLVDFEKRLVVLGKGFTLPQNPPRPRTYCNEYRFNDVVKVELIQDGIEVSSTSRGSQAVGTAVGALALGGVGAIIGGLSGSKRTQTGTKMMSIRVTVDDIDNPLHEILFYTAIRANGGRKGEHFFDIATAQITQMCAFLEAAIRRGQDTAKLNGDRKSPPPLPGARPPKPQWVDKDFASQLKDLQSLKLDGSITESEFNILKARVIRESA